jgi:hypothetical protein
MFIFSWLNGLARDLVSSFGFRDSIQLDTRSVGRCPLTEGSAGRKLKTQNTYQTNIRAPVGIRTRNLTRLAAAQLRLRPHGL